ncbi:MAG: ATP synthase F0 subunit B [Acidobacteriota bacterium]|nr:ATP synthase F0 subunit B [Acidobacteriota bacterium]
MRRRLLAACIWGGLLLSVCSQAAFAKGSDEQISEPAGDMKWKVINTALFVIGLGYLLRRSAPAFFNARSADIQKAIQDATGLKIEADFRYSEIDRKMATLTEEIGRMRAQSAAAMEREHERMRQDTAVEIQRLQQNIAAELEAFRNEGIRKVRRQTAQAAFALAEQRLRDKLAGSESDDLVRDFVQLVERGKN